MAEDYPETAVCPQRRRGLDPGASRGRGGFLMSGSRPNRPAPTSTSAPTAVNRTVPQGMDEVPDRRQIAWHVAEATIKGRV